MEGSKRMVERRVAGYPDRLLIALLGALLLCAWLRLPSLAPDLAFDYRSSPLSGHFGLGGRELSWVAECLVFTAVLLGFQAALLRFEISRLKLTRVIGGANAAVVLVTCVALLVVGLKVRAVFVPVGLAALWISSSFGLGAGLVTVSTSVALFSLAGMGEVLSAPMLVRAVAIVLFFRGVGDARDGLRAGVLAGGLGAAVAVSMNFRTQMPLLELLQVGAWPLVGGLWEGALYALTRALGERLLGHVARERLVALLDLSQPLLRRMMERAPGSFEHSRAMANLAEQAASAIGADALLTRVGAYYHDLGKSVEPKYFVENLSQGEVSPHGELSAEESAAHILFHVTEGAKILRDEGIPEAVVEFSYTHHGTQLVEYFLNKQKRSVGEENVDVEKFRYPGMKPKTAETAILMLVDSIEAASRTLDAPDRDRIEELVRRIVFAKLSAGQLDEAGLGMKELRVIISRVVETLIHMNHHRIKYPWQEEQAEQFGVGKGELSSQEPPTGIVRSLRS
jgi:hypothetical protein